MHTHTHTFLFFHVVWPGTLVRIPFVHSIMTCSIFLDSYVIIVGGDREAFSTIFLLIVDAWRQLMPPHAEA